MLHHISGFSTISECGELPTVSWGNCEVSLAPVKDVGSDDGSRAISFEDVAGLDDALPVDLGGIGMGRVAMRMGMGINANANEGGGGNEAILGNWEWH
jgi:hypothetical protein